MDDRMAIITETLSELLDAEDVAHQVDGCMSCGNCGNACPWYLSSNDPRLHPANRAGLVRRIYRKRGPTMEELEGLVEIFWKCNSCGRCTLACPMGISNRRLYQAMRGALTRSEVALPVLKKARENARSLHHTLGLDIKEAMKWVDMARGHGVEVPVDREGARYLLIPSFAETGKLPESLVNTAKILNALDIDYTTTSRIQDGGAEVHQALVDKELGKEYIETVLGAADDVGASTIMIAECGCDARTWFVEAASFLGRGLGKKVVLSGQVFHRSWKDGELPLDPSANPFRVTYHDPCYITRLTGWMEEPRELVRASCTGFVEMEPNREYNYCCTGGSGPLRVKEFEEARLAASSFKAEQIKASQADVVTSPCATCVLALRGTVDHYRLSARVMPMSEIILNALTRALEGEGRQDAIKKTGARG